MPVNGGTERTTTVIIGTGLSGLAVGAELRRRGVHAIVVDGLDILGAGQPANTASLQRCDAADSDSLRERNEILRHLRNYAASHAMDVRSTTRAVQLTMLADEEDGTSPATPGESTPETRSKAAAHGWAVHTPDGILLADNIVLTRCAHSQLRRMLSDLGITVGRNLVAAMRTIGIYLVGVGELITPSPKEVLRQAKTVGLAIASKVQTENAPALSKGSLPKGSFAV